MIQVPCSVGFAGFEGIIFRKYTCFFSLIGDILKKYELNIFRVHMTF